MSSDPSNGTSYSELFNNINNNNQQSYFSRQYLMSQINNPPPDDQVLNIQDLPQKRKNVRQPDDPIRKFNNTLPGYVINYLRKNGPTTEEVILENVRRDIGGLRSATGNKYKSKDPKSCLTGVSKMEIFEQVDGIWFLRNDEANEYEEETIEKFVQKSKKYNPTVFKAERSLKKSERMINLLKSYSKRLGEDPKYADLIRNPLKNIVGNEDLVDVSNKIGQERLIGILQAYDIVKKCFINDINRRNKNQASNAVIDGIYEKVFKIEEILEKKKERVEAANNL
ncbi:unnamed protein product [Blepharisma stoltei]|uniref:Uncharacterized protein n=1 Tax=Blepharisma stoltei TaxID=1481888 RepID=A0AAU9JFC3_9CILI|nr:unnamed protein product [Blepharisma stoltei]